MRDASADLTIVGPRQALFMLMAGSGDKLKKVASVSGDAAILDKICTVFTALEGAGKFNIIEP